MNKSQDSENASINLIGAGTSIKGDVRSGGDIRIDGSVAGQVHSKGRVVIGPTGHVEGEISCQNAEISGTLLGNITVTELLSLKQSANLKGEVATAKLSIEPGANFSGNCSMGGVVKDLNKTESRKEKAEKTA